MYSKFGKNGGNIQADMLTFDDQKWGDSHLQIGSILRATFAAFFYKISSIFFYKISSIFFYK